MKHCSNAVKHTYRYACYSGTKHLELDFIPFVLSEIIILLYLNISHLRFYYHRVFALTHSFYVRQGNWTQKKSDRQSDRQKTRVHPYILNKVWNWNNDTVRASNACIRISRSSGLFFINNKMNCFQNGNKNKSVEKWLANCFMSSNFFFWYRITIRWIIYFELRLQVYLAAVNCFLWGKFVLKCSLF